MLFLFLFGACVAMNQLQPLPSLPSQNLISIAKTNPLALVEMLDGADPKAVTTIIGILEDLVDEGLKQKKILEDAVKTGEDNVKTLTDKVNDARRKHGEAKGEHDDAVENEAHKEGVWQAATSSLATGRISLDNEIAVLKNVLDILKGLLDNNTKGLLTKDGTNKALVALGSITSLGRTGTKGFQEMLTKVKANPATLQKIIDLVGIMLRKAEDELNRLEEAVKSATTALEAAKSVTIEKKGLLDAATDALNDCLDELETAHGALAEATRELNKRGPILDQEDATLKKVIELLQKL
jgi:chromosome segregation ATPase